MTIDLTRFVKEKEEIVPIINNKGKKNGRLIKQNVEDGWYLVELTKGKVVRPARPLEVFRTLKKLSYYRVYALGGEGVAINFDNLLKQGLEETIVIHSLNLEPFRVARAVRWEDGQFYFLEVDNHFQSELLKQLKNLFDKEESLNLKGITPELQYYYLLLNLQRQSFREFQELEKLKISEAERQKRITEFQNTFQGRLHDLVDRAGGQLIRYFKVNADSYMIHWRIKDTEQVIKSTIRDNFRILNLGFCASGHDREHSLASAVQLAKMYGNEIYITRE